MLRTIVLFSSIALLQSCMPQTEEMQECLFKKEMMTKYYDGVNETIQGKQSAPSQNIPYWVFSNFNHSIVIPVDSYNEVLVFPTESLERANSIILKGSSYTIKLGGMFMDIANHSDENDGAIDSLKLGIKSKLSDTVCITKTVKSDIDTLWAIGYKAMLISGTSSYINKLDSSNDGWLFTSEKGRDRYEWRTLLISSNNVAFEYGINHINTKDYRPISGLLSQNNIDIIANASKKPPQWIPFLIDAFDTSFKEAKKTITPELEKHGFSSVDLKGFSYLAFGKD